MLKWLNFFLHIKNVIEITQLPKKKKRIVFYSEGENYWVHLEALVKEILATTDISICYISSSNNDPGLFLDHINYHSFKIDEGFVRNWLFENIETDVMVMTMPDLHQYQVKRSKFDVHYVYLQHSLVSLHMVYRKGAFDYYDTIFCAGPHHVKEIRAIETKYNLPPKKLVEHGYGRLDSIIAESKKRPKDKNIVGNPKHVLIAPSWGPNGVIESGAGEEIVEQLLEHGYQVTFRPHPQTVKFSKEKIDTILKKYSSNKMFAYETNVAGQDSLHESDMMISDWSGAALDYAFGLNKPVLFVDVPRKINNEAYEGMNIKPLEVEIRSLLGDILALDDIDKCGQHVSRLFSTEIKMNKSDYVFNIGNSETAGCLALKNICCEK